MGMGLSVAEMSHRESAFQDIAKKLEHDFRKMMKVPDHFRVLLTQGGATQ